MNYFINFSNHPSSTWSEEQLNAAKEYGTIIDVPFPNIKPTDTIVDLECQCDKFIDYVNNLAKGKDNVTIHIMGEMVFTYMIVDYFTTRHLALCLASTTERVVEEKDGVKISKFKFVKFRPYYSINRD